MASAKPGEAKLHLGPNAPNEGPVQQNGDDEHREGHEAADDSSSHDNAGIARRLAPERVVVGEIRQNLDDLKAAVLSYYSRLYSHTGRSIEERLDRLAAPPFSNSVKTGRLPLAAHARPRSKKQQLSFATPPPNTCFDFLTEGQKGMS